MVWSLLSVNKRSITKNIFNAGVEVKGRGGSGGGSSTKPSFHLGLVCFTGPLLACGFQYPNVPHVYSINGI